MSLGVLSSTNDRNYFEESFEWVPQVVSSDVYAETVPAAATPIEADANVAANPTILQKLNGYTLDEIPGSNGQGYSTYTTPGNTSTPRLIDWLSPQKFGNGYAFTLVEQDDTPIALTDGAYQVDYKNGIIRFDPNFRPADLGYSLPLKLTAYRYIGSTIADATSTLVITETDLDPSISNVSEIRFQPGSVTSLGGGVVEIDTSAGVSGDVFRYEAFTVTTPGVTQFTLAQAPSDVTKTILTSNGIAYHQKNGHLSIAGALVTWLSLAFPYFDTQDSVVITYTV